MIQSSNLSETHCARDLDLIRATMPSTNGMDFSTQWKICIRVLLCWLTTQYSAISTMLMPMSDTAVNRTSIKAPRSGASIKSQIFRQRRLERRVLRMRANIAEIFRLAAEFQIRRARAVAIGGNSHGGQVIFSVRQREAETERAVGTKFDFVSAERDFCI